MGACTYASELSGLAGQVVMYVKGSLTAEKPWVILDSLDHRAQVHHLRSASVLHVLARL